MSRPSDRAGLSALQRARRRTRRTPLLVAILLAVVFGAGLLWAGYLIFAASLDVRTDDSAAPGRIDIVRVALTAVAGVGGAVALVVAYRRQNDLEQGRFVERFGAAAAQLGNTDPAVRLAGVYAMAGVADESTTFSRRQQCIDVLCGYLRLPYIPDEGASGLTETTTTSILARPAAGGQQRTETQETRKHAVRHNDREVRQTIVRVVVAHLQAAADTSWSAHDFDFTGVHFDDANFGEARFSGNRTSFSEATFSGRSTYFDKATFSGEDTSFVGATFSSGFTSFVEATFSGRFIGFVEVTFSMSTDFGQATFSSRFTSFGGATFSGERAGFGGATFSGERTIFDKATFSDVSTYFGGATFSGWNASFGGATFSGERTSFGKATFRGRTASFRGARFSGNRTDFGGATFTGGVTDFGQATFSRGITDFGQGAFSAERTNFDGAVFSGANTSFKRATFSKGRTDFRDAVFSSGPCSFENPERWDNVVTDWDDDHSLKPANVEPHEWPPVVVTPDPD